MLNLKLQYFCHLMWRADSMEKTLLLGKIEGRKRGWQGMRWLHGITDSMDMSFEQSLGYSEGLQCFMGLQKVEHDLATGQQVVWCAVYFFYTDMSCILSMCLLTLIRLDSMEAGVLFHRSSYIFSIYDNIIQLLLHENMMIWGIQSNFVRWVFLSLLRSKKMGSSILFYR